ncbi:hypothetical protein KL942_003119 [Ogataea angusta]|uniref:Uncharacterized protein n=1 Tax=Pichia angusta TaxID=870730 RepID=A0ABQ7RQH4_PICAN|nr:hypothetical protein KL942_003119 [Ogataea angusta]KAG7845832.1 hypothetical protein KL940_004877 [Ogataea angusta]
MDRRLLIIGTPGVPPSGSSLFITDDTPKPLVWEDSVFLALESERRHWPNALINRLLQDRWTAGSTTALYY